MNLPGPGFHAPDRRETAPAAAVASTDLTPADFRLPDEGRTERLLKRPIRRVLYPPYNRLAHAWLARRYGRRVSLPVDQWLWGHRGNDFARHRRRVNRIAPLAGRRLLIPGCGTGRDVPSWVAYRPESVLGVDLFSYARAWSMLAASCRRRFPEVSVEFRQGDITRLDGLADDSFDLVGSDALFEHVPDLPAALAEFHRVLRPGAILHATFGPLWYCWGGDHVHGHDGVSNGFDHLLLDRDDYRRTLEAAGGFKHSEHDGRTWDRHGLFSYLRPAEYVAMLEARFTRVFMAAVIEPRAVQYLASHPAERARLEGLVPAPLDLVILGLIVIYRKPASPGRGRG